MHACGHDGHVAILIAAAEIFAKLRGELPGTAKLLFQPAEEGLPIGEGGAQLMLKDGAFDGPTPEVVFGLHVTSLLPADVISYRVGAVMTGSNTFPITVKGPKTHGALPWRGVEPIVVGAQIVRALQIIESRQIDVTREPSVLTMASLMPARRRTSFLKRLRSPAPSGDPATDG
jgi:amidohydrolase